jgi:hypothetical protein
VKFPALNKQYNLKSRSDLLECDYIHKLNDEEKAFLNKFNEEFVNASFEKDNKKNLHKTADLKKDCYDRNNARNRCILTKAKASGKHVNFSELNEDQIMDNYEEKIIYVIDKKKKREKQRLRRRILRIVRRT